MRSSRCAARYLSAPLLLDGTHKFDIRLYVLMCVLIVSNNGRNCSSTAATHNLRRVTQRIELCHWSGRPQQRRTFAAQRYSGCCSAVPLRSMHSVGQPVAPVCDTGIGWFTHSAL